MLRWIRIWVSSRVAVMIWKHWVMCWCISIADPSHGRDSRLTWRRKNMKRLWKRRCLLLSRFCANISHANSSPIWTTADHYDLKTGLTTHISGVCSRICSLENRISMISSLIGRSLTTNQTSKHPAVDRTTEMQIRWPLVPLRSRFITRNQLVKLEIKSFCHSPVSITLKT